MHASNGEVVVPSKAVWGINSAHTSYAEENTESAVRERG